MICPHCKHHVEICRRRIAPEAIEKFKKNAAKLSPEKQTAFRSDSSSRAR